MDCGGGGGGVGVREVDIRGGGGVEFFFFGWGGVEVWVWDLYFLIKNYGFGIYLNFIFSILEFVELNGFGRI